MQPINSVCVWVRCFFLFTSELLTYAKALHDIYTSKQYKLLF
jgi:hypothetical protein